MEAVHVSNNNIINNLAGNFCGHVPNGKIDCTYKRCYTDNQGNFVDPRTRWDELLKYCHPWEMLLTSEGDRRMATPVPVIIRKKMKLERAQRARLAQIHRLEARYLKTKERERKRAARRKIYELEAQYLELKKAHDSYSS